MLPNTPLAQASQPRTLHQMVKEIKIKTSNRGHCISQNPCVRDDQRNTLQENTIKCHSWPDDNPAPVILFLADVSTHMLYLTSTRWCVCNMGEVEHSSLLCVARPANRYSRNSDQKVIKISVEAYSNKILNFQFLFRCLLPIQIKHVLRKLVPLNSSHNSPLTRWSVRR